MTVQRVRRDCCRLPGLQASGGVWAMLLCSSMEVEPETVPRPWLLPFIQQGAAVIVLGGGVSGEAGEGGQGSLPYMLG